MLTLGFYLFSMIVVSSILLSIIGILSLLLYFARVDIGVFKEEIEFERDKDKIHCNWCKHCGDCSKDSKCWTCSTMFHNNFEKKGKANEN